MSVRERRDLPDPIANAPELWIGLELYWGAFWDLSTCRAGGLGLLPIPWMAIHMWADAFELDTDQREDLFYFVRVMDNVFVEHHTPAEGKKWQKGGIRESSQKGWKRWRKG